MAIITISRQYGARGARVGQMAADCLGYRFVDQAILHKIAEDAGVPVKSVREIERIAGDFWHSLFTELAAKMPVVRHVPGIASEFDEEKYRMFLKRAITEIAARDNAVIVGRGGQMILRDHPRALRFYLVGKDEDRAAHLMEAYHVDRERAETVAIKEEQKRLAFLEGFNQGNPHDPRHYHLVFNTSVLEDSQITHMICRLVGDMKSSG